MFTMPWIYGLVTDTCVIRDNGNVISFDLSPFAPARATERGKAREEEKKEKIAFFSQEGGSQG